MIGEDTTSSVEVERIGGVVSKGRESGCDSETEVTSGFTSNGNTDTEDSGSEIVSVYDEVTYSYSTDELFLDTDDVISDLSDKI